MSPWQHTLFRYLQFLALAMLLAGLFCLSQAFAHDSWINKQDFRSPSGMSNPGVHCCGDNDCGYWDGRAGEEIALKSDGYHVDATFTLDNPNHTTFHIKRIVPEDQTFPFSQDGMYWACINWGAYQYHDEYPGEFPANPVRCFFAPPPGS